MDANVAAAAATTTTGTDNANGGVTVSLDTSRLIVAPLFVIALLVL